MNFIINGKECMNVTKKFQNVLVFCNVFVLMHCKLLTPNLGVTRT